MADKKSDRTDLGDFLLNAQNDLGHGMALLDPKTGKIGRANDVFSNIFGYTSKELSALPSFASLASNDNQIAVREHFRGHERRPSFEMTAVGKSGRRLWIAVSLSPVRLGTVTAVAALVNDVTRRREAEEQVLLLETITLAVNDAPDFQTALGVALRKVCVATGWEYGLAWVPSADRKTISVSSGSYGAGPGLERFREAMQGIELGVGDDLPGRAFSLRQPQWADDLSLLRSFRRQTVLREFGVRVCMAIPVLALDQVVAVLEFCVSERHSNTKDFFLGLASAIAPQLGSVFQKKRAEEERDRIFNLSVDMICVASHDGYFRHVNPAWTRVLGYTAHELISRPFLEMVHPEDRDKTAAELGGIRDGLESRGFENRYIAKDGSIRWLMWNSTNFPNQKLVYAIARDITDRKKREEELRRSNTFLDQIVENIPDMIFIKDAKDLKFIRFNKAGEALLGMSREQLIGKSDADFFPPEEAQFFTTKDRQVLLGGKVVDIPEEIIHTARGVRILHTKKIPILDESGKPLYLLGISEDVTERKPRSES